MAWTYWGAPSVSPDGKHVAIGATGNGAGTLWIRRMDGVAFRRIDNVSRFNVAEHIAWSADSRWVVFAEGPQLKRAAVSGGTPEVICRLPEPEDFAGATVNADGVVLLGFNNGPLHRVALSGGRPEPIGSLDAAHGEVGQAMPFFLPGGKQYLFVSRAKGPSAVVGVLGSSERTALITDAERPSYVSPGLLLFVRNGRPMALLFDLSSLAVSGEPRVLESQLNSETVTASSNGTLVYRSQIGGNVRRHGEVYSGNTRLAWFDRSDGKPASSLHQQAKDVHRSSAKP